MVGTFLGRVRFGRVRFGRVRFGRVRSLAAKSPGDIARYALARLSERADVERVTFPLHTADIADSAALSASAQSGTRWHPSLSARPRAAWVVIAPGAGSGGHTTLFRMMEAARVAGFENTLLFYDRHGSDFARNAAVVRMAWPWLDCEIDMIGQDLHGFDVAVASSWPTAHVVARRRLAGQPAAYFVQDFEPYFSPHGSTYAMAEDSYRLGLHAIALGEMVAAQLRADVGVDCTPVPFGCDRDTYRVLPGGGARDGVVCYVKKGSDRRGYRLAIMALERFHREHPGQRIHLYGDTPRGLPFPFTAHGTLTPAALNELYNRVAVGITFSFTNISLVPDELLRAGVVPVVNDSPPARLGLHNPHVEWAAATPASVADAVAAALDRVRCDPQLPARIAASVTTVPWSVTGAAVAGILHDDLAAATRLAEGAGTGDPPRASSGALARGSR